MPGADERGKLVTAGQLLGRGVRITVEPGIAIEGPPDGLEPWSGARAAPSGPAGTVHVHLVRSPSDPARGAVGEAPSIVVNDVTVPVRRVEVGADVWWELGDDAAGGRIRLIPSGASVVAWDAEGQWASAPAVAALQFLAMEGMRGCGLVPLHAAVVAHGEAGLALLGPSGAGKSTTLLRAVREGWAAVSEDLAWVDPETLLVERGDHGVRVWPEARDRYLPWLAALPWHPEPDGKTLLPYEALGAGATSCVRLERVAVLSAADQEPGREGLSPRELARALWEAAGYPVVPANQQALGGHVARLAGRLRGERLRLGGLPRPD